MAEHASTLIAGMEQARALLGVENEPEAELVERAAALAAARGMTAYFAKTVGDDGALVTTFTVETARGNVEGRPQEGETWEDVVKRLL